MSDYLIGVIADTHNRWNPSVAEIFAGVDEIWHLGDVCDETILDELRAIQSKLTVVEGNNDWKLNYPLTRDIERNGEKFHLIHIQPKQPPAGTQWLLFGHTHVSFDHVEKGVHYFNPGSAGQGRRGSPLSVGILTKESGKPFRSEIILL